KDRQHGDGQGSQDGQQFAECFHHTPPEIIGNLTTEHMYSIAYPGAKCNLPAKREDSLRLHKNAPTANFVTHIWGVVY
ncbi:MAG: hypothetical protein ACI4OL_08445, partial [Gemmiger sp.]